MQMPRVFDRAKVQLMKKKNSVFLSTLLFSLKHTITKAVPTAATNGIELVINPDFFMSISETERVGVLVHECMHVAWNHMERGRHLDKERYNAAADYVINIGLIDAGFELPAGGLIDKQYRGMSTKQVYDLLPVTLPNNPMGGDVQYNDGSKESRERQMEVANILVKAIMRSEMEHDTPGTVPAEISRMVEKLINPKLGWDTLLQNYMSSFQKDDYSMRKPNRRYAPDFYLPSQYSERLTNISVAIDLSGSISEKQLQAFLSEINYIHSTMNPETMTIIGFDTKVTDIHEIDEGQDILSLKFRGGGGTDIKPVFKYFNKTKPNVAIIFSDMWFNWPSKPLECEHIWVIIDNSTASPSSGEITHYTSEHE